MSATSTIEQLDNRQVPCAIGLITAQRRMRELSRSTVLEILSRDRFAPMEITVWAQRDGHAIESMTRAGVWPLRHHVIRVRKHETDGET